MSLVHVRIGGIRVSAGDLREAPRCGGANAVRQRVVPTDAQAAGSASRHRQPQPLISLPADGVVLIHEAKGARPSRILQGERAALVQVGGGAAHRVRDAVDDTRTKTQEHARVEAHLRPEVIRVAAQIVRRYRPVVPELLFKRDVPRLHARRLNVRIHHAERAEGREHRIRVRGDRVRVSTDGCVRVVKGCRRDQRTIAPGRRRGIDVHEIAAREIVCQAVGGPERQTAVSSHVPRKPHARRHIQPPLVIAALAFGEAAVARVGHPGRRIEKHRALRALQEFVVIEICGPAIEHLLAQEGFPANTIVERDAVAHPPGVLRVQSRVHHVHDEQIRHAVLDAPQGSDEQVSQPAAGRLPVEHEAASGSGVRGLGGLPVGEIDAEPHLMAPTHQRDVVSALEGIGPEDARGGCGRRDVEPPGDSQHHLALAVRVEVPDAEIEWIEEGRAPAVDGRPVERDTQRVHHVIAEHERIAERRRLRKVVEASASGERQHVVGLRKRRRGFVECAQVAAEDRVVAALLIVDAAEPLPGFAVGWLTVRDLSALVVCLWQERHEVQRGRAEARGSDLVVHERGPQRDRRATVASRRGVGGEVAAQHRLGGHEGDVAGGHLMHVGALIRAEEEQLIPDHRSAGRPAVLIARQAIVHTLAVDHAGERIRRVETAVAVELEQVAREPVGPGPGDRVDRRARVHPVLRGETGRGDPELLQRIGEGQRQVRVVLRIVVHGAVEQVGDAEGQSAGHGHIHGAPEAAAVRAARIHGRADHHEQARHLPPLQRHLQDPFVFNDLADAGAPHVHERGRRFDGD